MQDFRQIPLARRFGDEIKDEAAGPGWHSKRIGRRVSPCAVAPNPRKTQVTQAVTVVAQREPVVTVAGAARDTERW